MKITKLLILLTLLICQSVAFANPFRILEIALKAQQRVENLDHQIVLNRLDKINDSLEKIDNSLEERIDSTGSLSDIERSECEDVSVEQNICEHMNNDLYEELECSVEIFSHANFQ